MARMVPDQSFYPSPTMAMRRPPETLAYVAHAQSRPGGPDALAVLDVDPALEGYGAADRPGRHAGRRRRAAPLRVERVQLVPVPVLAAPAHGAALPGRPRHAIVAHPHPRHEARSAASRASSR